MGQQGGGYGGVGYEITGLEGGGYGTGSITGTDGRGIQGSGICDRLPPASVPSSLLTCTLHGRGAVRVRDRQEWLHAYSAAMPPPLCRLGGGQDAGTERMRW